MHVEGSASILALIELNHLTKTFKGKTQTVDALKDINLHIEQGNIFGIIGMSGAGKSTLVRCLNLLETPDSGTLSVGDSGVITLKDGKAYDAQGRKMTEKKLGAMRRGIGMIFQHFNLLDRSTVFENIAYPLRYTGMKKADMEARVFELLDLVDLRDKADVSPSQLSGGQKQRVAIARALATKPRYLLCDEATSALDPTTTQSILSLLKEINRTMGVTVIVITHEMRVIDQICDRVAVIDRGQIAELGAVSQVFTNPQSKIARELILPGVSIAPVFTPGGKRIRLAFNGETTRHPVVASLIMECQAPVNIVSADIREIDGKIYGQTILELPADEASAERARAWLKQDGVSFEEV